MAILMSAPSGFDFSMYAKSALSLITFGMCPAVPRAAQEAVPPPAPNAQATSIPIKIFHDPWGIPQIFATDAGAFYGLNYTTSEDRTFQMTYSLRIIQGDWSKR